MPASLSCLMSNPAERWGFDELACPKITKNEVFENLSIPRPKNECNQSCLFQMFSFCSSHLFKLLDVFPPSIKHYGEVNDTHRHTQRNRHAVPLPMNHSPLGPQRTVAPSFFSRLSEKSLIRNTSTCTNDRKWVVPEPKSQKWEMKIMKKTLYIE